MKNFFDRFIFFTFITLVYVTDLSGQNRALHYADSLFVSKKYTEAFNDYEKIYQQQLASPSMLMKMAYIKEGLGDYAEALYYLNVYYRQTSDKDALDKMRDIAEEHNLSGYEYSDFKFFLNTTRKFENEIVLCLMAFSAFLIVYIIKRKRKGEQPITATFLQLITISLIAVHINGLVYQDSAIIAEDKTLLMSGPSGASEPLDLISKGHKVDVLEGNAIWSKIKWEDREVYIRNKNLKLL